ncbi:MAG: radical SAM protein [Bryobacterales bacterium]|nr:radical SAM protein [Bryobacterales bacterium]
MLVHGFIEGSRVNGPGLRAVVHLQGCNLNCPGCFNVASHPFTGLDHDPAEVAAWVVRANGVRTLDGVTFSGGEPMQQAPALFDVIESLSRRLPQLGFGMYSGYSLRELEAGRFRTTPEIAQTARREVWASIRSFLDFAVLGRYVATRPSALPLRSSANQELLLFTDRYCDHDFAPQEVEVHIEPHGLVQVTGFPVAGLPV